MEIEGVMEPMVAEVYLVEVVGPWGVGAGGCGASGSQGTRGGGRVSSGSGEAWGGGDGGGGIVVGFNALMGAMGMLEAAEVLEVMKVLARKLLTDRSCRKPSTTMPTSAAEQGHIMTGGVTQASRSFPGIAWLHLRRKRSK